VRACGRVAGTMGGCVRIRACSFANPACNACAPCCNVICGLSISAIFFDIICKTNIARYRKCRNVFMYCTRWSCRILIELEFYLQIFEKSSNAKFHQNPSIGNRVPCGQTEMRKLIVAFHNFANASKNESPCARCYKN
jgi:hypothetical protein